MPAWTVDLKESVIDDLQALGIKQVRAVLKEASTRLAENPLAQTRHLKTLRPNPVAERELRLFGRYRVLFTVAEAEALGATEQAVAAMSASAGFHTPDSAPAHHAILSTTDNRAGSPGK
jgi:mRNA-degrading endonuclease RelE of RelBE toxin-antitoxin system